MVDRIHIAVPPQIDLYKGPSTDSDLVETRSENLQAIVILANQDLDTYSVVLQTKDGQIHYKPFPDERKKRIQQILEMGASKSLLTPREEMGIQGQLETILFYGKDPQDYL